MEKNTWVRIGHVWFLQWRKTPQASVCGQCAAMGKDRTYGYPELLLDLGHIDNVKFHAGLPGDGKVHDDGIGILPPDKGKTKDGKTISVHVLREYRRIADELCEFYGVTVERVLVGTTDHKMTVIKMALARKLREEHDLSYPVIGRLMGRDHSTIAYYLGKRKREWRNGKYRPTMDKLRNRKAD